MSAELAVIIVNWNTRDLTLDALETLYSDLQQRAAPRADVWVVDNASTDESVATIQERFPKTRIIESKENLGFAAGNNAALRELGFGRNTPDANLPRAVYLLNSDTRTRTGATTILYQALFSLPNAGVVGARLTYAEGGLQHAAFRFPGLTQLWFELMPAPSRFYDSRLNGRYPLHLYSSSRPFVVDHTLGATMMIRREVIQQTGLFDEGYYMYAEEIDWSWRIREAGWDIYCVPAAHVTHLGGRSTDQVRPQSVINLWQSRLLFFAKYYPRWKLYLAKRIIHRGMQRKIKQTR
ncbi:MAG TPA: glycosyltransferase family 2 protein, partial [Aggregatilineales bacterium]|nr:glycosyltransferase family 2 protein [Aggregatilineales bacterium]